MSNVPFMTLSIQFICVNFSFYVENNLIETSILVKFLDFRALPVVTGKSTTFFVSLTQLCNAIEHNFGHHFEYQFEHKRQREGTSFGTFILGVH